jgi:hypothetical protein
MNPDRIGVNHDLAVGYILSDFHFGDEQELILAYMATLIWLFNRNC